MNESVMLKVSSVLAMLLFSIHVTDDVVRGIEGGGLEHLFGMLILVVWLYGALVSSERWWNRVIVILGALLAAVVPVLHMRGTGVGGEFARSPGAFRYIWTLYALGVTGAFSLILSARGLLSRKSEQPVRHAS